MKIKHLPGFTVVELLIVLVVISILAAVSIVGYRGMNIRAADTQSATDISKAADLLKLDYLSARAYPASASAVNGGKGFKPTAGTTLNYSVSSDAQSFCLMATSSRSGTKSYATTHEGGVKASTCYAATYTSGAGGTYSCPNGGTLSGTNCNTTTTYPATEGPGGYFYCPTGTSPGGPWGGTCVVNGTDPPQYVTEDYQEGPYVCSSGDTLNGSTCTKTSSYPATYSGDTGGSYVCNSGDTIYGAFCMRP